MLRTAEIVISCKCEPYKISVDSSDEPWKWDTFSFINGVIRNTSDITISSGSGWQKVTLDGWVHNETLRIVSNAEMKVRYRNSTYTIYTGENIMYDIVLYKGVNDLSGAIPIVCEITNNGNSWTYSHLRVYNGIIVGYWN